MGSGRAAARLEGRDFDTLSDILTVALSGTAWHSLALLRQIPRSFGTLWHSLTLSDTPIQQSLDPKVQGSTHCANTTKRVRVRLASGKASADASQYFG